MWARQVVTCEGEGKKEEAGSKLTLLITWSFGKFGGCLNCQVRASYWQAKARRAALDLGFFVFFCTLYLQYN